METEKAIKSGVKYRKSAAITLVSSIITFVLFLIAFLSTAENGKLQVYELVTLNTSTLLQNVIKVESASPTTTGQAKRAAQLPTLPAISLPGTSQISSFFAGVTSGIATAASPSATTTASSSGSDLLGSLESLLGDIAGDLTGAAGDGLVEVANGLVGDVISAIGIKQWYSLYMTQYCEGDYTPSFSASNAREQVDSCKSLTSASLLNLNQTPSTLQIGQTVVDFSALNIPNKLSQAGGQLKSLLTAIFAFEIIGIVYSGLLIVFTPCYLIFRIFQRRPVRFVIAGLSTLAFSFLSLVATIMTGIVVIATGAINQLADGLGIKAHKGGNALALIWVSTVLMGLSTGAWFLQWHSATFSRKSRGKVS